MKSLGHDLTYEVWDEDIVADDHIGSGISKVSAFVLDGKGIDEWFAIQFKGVAAGKIHFKCEWTH